MMSENLVEKDQPVGNTAKNNLYKAFISYSHKAGGRLAPALESACYRIAKPWYKLRAFKVFRDKTGLALTNALWPDIERALSRSEHLILLASPEARKSRWVQKEIAFWRKNKSTKKLLIGWVGGTLAWDYKAGDFDWENTSALPRELLEKSFDHEPLYADLRELETEEDLSLENERFVEGVAQIVSTLHEKTPSELFGEDVRQHRIFRTVAWGVGIALLFLAVALGFAAHRAYVNQIEAEARRDEALKTQSLFLSDLANQQIEKGDAVTAANLALEALPVHMSAPDRPYVNEAEITLYRAVHRNGVRAELIGQDEHITTVVFSTKGTYVATGSTDGRVGVWDGVAGGVIGFFKAGEGLVWTLEFSDDETRLLTSTDSNTVDIWEIPDLDNIAQLADGHDDLRKGEFSPDGKRVFVLKTNGELSLWNGRTGDGIKKWREVEEAEFDAQCRYLFFRGTDGAIKLASATDGGELNLERNDVRTARFAGFNGRGDRLACVLDGGFARVWDTGSLKLLSNWAGLDDNEIETARLDAGDDYLITVDADNTMKKRQLESGEVTNRIAWLNEDETLERVHIERQRFLTVTSKDKLLHLYDLESGEELRPSFQRGPATIGKVLPDLYHFSKDGRYVLASLTNGSTRIVECLTAETVMELEGYSVNDASFHPSSLMIATGHSDGSARLWNLDSHGELLTLYGHQGAVNEAHFSADNRCVLSASEDGTVRLWDLRTRRELRPPLEERRRIPVLSARFTNDKEYIASLSSVFARVWNLSDLSAPKPLVATFGSVHKKSLNAADISPDGQRIVVASDDASASLSRVEDGELITLLEGHRSEVNHVVFSHGGDRILTVSSDATARLWDGFTGTEIKALEGAGGELLHGAFSPDGRWITAASSDGKAFIWPTDGNNEAAPIVLRGHAEYLFWIGFDPGGERIATTSSDGTARIWRVEDGRLIHALSGHRGEILNADFSSDGSRLVTASYDSTARVWDLATGRCLAVLDDHGERVEYAEFSPDDQWVLTTSLDETVKVWRMFKSTQEVIDHANRVLPRGLRPEQRKAFFLTAGSE